MWATKHTPMERLQLLQVHLQANLNRGFSGALKIRIHKYSASSLRGIWSSENSGDVQLLFSFVCRRDLRFRVAGRTNKFPLPFPQHTHPLERLQELWVACQMNRYKTDEPLNPWNRRSMVGHTGVDTRWKKGRARQRRWNELSVSASVRQRNPTQAATHGSPPEK